MYQFSRLKQFLEENGLSAKKIFSQNFLIDGNILKKITALAKVNKDDQVLEIGPGPGALTEELLNLGATVTAVEIDRDFAALLTKRLGSDRLNVLNHDILDVDLSTLFDRPVKVIANLPYHITSPILTKLAPLKDRFSSITVVIQKEVAERICAVPGSKQFGSISLFLDFYTEIEFGFVISKNCFYPTPKVDSAAIKLTPHPPPDVSDSKAFINFFRTAFQQRRKMLKSSTDKLFPKLWTEDVLMANALKKEARPEELSLEEFITVFDALNARQKKEPQ